MAAITAVLFVDDSTLQHHLLKGVLKGINVNTTIAISGEAALQQFAPGRFNLVIMDYEMGTGMNGAQAAMEIHVKDPSAQIVGYTSSWEDGKIVQAYAAAGVKIILPKEIDRVRALILKFLQDGSLI